MNSKSDHSIFESFEINKENKQKYSRINLYKQVGKDFQGDEKSMKDDRKVKDMIYKYIREQDQANNFIQFINVSEAPVQKKSYFGNFLR